MRTPETGMPGRVEPEFSARASTNETGRFLLETVLVVGIGTVAILSTLAMIPATVSLNELTRERSTARNAIEQKVAELRAFRIDDFRESFSAVAAEAGEAPAGEPSGGGPAGGTTATDNATSFDVNGLEETTADTQNGAITIFPDPTSDPAGFDAATIYTVNVEVSWRGPSGDHSLNTAIFLSPPPTTSTSP